MILLEVRLIILIDYIIQGWTLVSAVNKCSVPSYSPWSISAFIFLPFSFFKSLSRQKPKRCCQVLISLTKQFCSLACGNFLVLINSCEQWLHTVAGITIRTKWTQASKKWKLSGVLKHTNATSYNNLVVCKKIHLIQFCDVTIIYYLKDLY